MYVVTLPAFQRCLKDGPDAAERRPGSGFPTGRGTGDGHLEAHHDLQATPARPGRATRLGVRRSIVPAAPRTSYSSFYKAGGKGSLFCNGKKKNGADFTRHNLTIHPIPMICAWNALLDLCSRKLYRQQQTRFDPGLHFHYFFHNEGTAPASVDVVERPPESKIELLLLSPRETIRYLNRLKESEEAATLPAHGEASSFWSTSSALNAPQSESKRIGQGDVRDET